MRELLELLPFWAWAMILPVIISGTYRTYHKLLVEMGNVPTPPFAIKRPLSKPEPTLKVCAYCGKVTEPDMSGACPNCAGHEWKVKQ